MGQLETNFSVAIQFSNFGAFDVCKLISVDNSQENKAEIETVTDTVGKKVPKW